ncbi:HalX domain-containing protein [Natronomonas amylolytica]|uniref:HalX domain-containing protein n=1 Tax=Natronomonas amylolytica TaxID=3108498 RepID=UPI0030094CC6
MSRGTNVLIVDDEAALADLYAAWLEQDWDVETAYGGREALEMVGPETDIVLLDRRMPDISGDEVLDEIRNRDLDCRVAMVTAVDPEFDILDMPFDTYLSKPVPREELTDAVERLDALSEYEDAFQRHFALVSKRAALESEHPRTELRSNDEYEALLEEIEAVEADIDELTDDFDDADFDVLLSNL